MPFELPGFTLVQARFRREGDTTYRAADDVINTFCFANEGSPDPLEEIRARLDEFYWTTAPNSSRHVGQHLSRAITGLTYVMRAADAPTGTPGVELPSLAFSRPTAQTAYPPDVAVCISYRSQPPYTARRRGRIYLGPLNTTIAGGSEGVVLNTAMAALNGAAQRLAESADLGDVTWGIASRAGNSFSRIHEGYVDEHFDTQRRRDPGTEVFGRHPSDWVIP